jgi:hypothetical protein
MDFPDCRVQTREALRGSCEAVALDSFVMRDWVVVLRKCKVIGNRRTLQRRL